MKQIKKILFKIKLNGYGVVNFDSSEQKKILKELSNENLNDNVKLCKKHFFTKGYDENGNPITDFKLKISSACLRHYIWKDDLFVNTPLMLKYYSLLEQMMLTNTSISHGYLATFGDKSYKKKSALSISDAIQTNNTIINREIGTASGIRTDNSMFFYDTIGETEYESEGLIDLSELEFISGDILFDRAAYASDKNANETIIKKYEEETYGVGADKEPDFKEGYYTNMFNSFGNTFPEKGIYVSDLKIVEIVKFLLKNLLEINIVRASGFAQTSSLEIKLIGDLHDKFSDEWIKIENECDINNIMFEPYRTYKEIDEQYAICKHLELEKCYKEIQENQKEKKSGKGKGKKNNKKNVNENADSNDNSEQTENDE